MYIFCTELFSQGHILFLFLSLKYGRLVSQGIGILSADVFVALHCTWGSICRVERILLDIFNFPEAISESMGSTCSSSRENKSDTVNIRFKGR